MEGSERKFEFVSQAYTRTDQLLAKGKNIEHTYCQDQPAHSSDSKSTQRDPSASPANTYRNIRCLPSLFREARLPTFPTAGFQETFSRKLPSNYRLERVRSMHPGRP